MTDQLSYVKDLVATYEFFLEEIKDQPKFDKKTLKLMCAYKGSLAYDVNARLRNIPITYIEDDEHRLYKQFNKASTAQQKQVILQKYIKYIDRYITKFNVLFDYSPKFKKDTILYRIIYNTSKFMPSIGETIILKGYTSCSFDLIKLVDYFGGLHALNKPWTDDVMIVKINVKTGVPYIFIDAFCLNDRSIMNKQGEVVLPHGISFKLTKQLAPIKHIKVFDGEIFMNQV